MFGCMLPVLGLSATLPMTGVLANVKVPRRTCGPTNFSSGVLLIAAPAGEGGAAPIRERQADLRTL
jgi:hypothetical protein